MKKIYLTLFFAITSLLVYPQAVKAEKSYLKECAYDDNPNKCTSMTIIRDIEALVNYTHLEGLLNSEQKEFFCLSLVFVTDEQGKVIPEDSEVMCPYEPLKQSVEDYIGNLPEFVSTGSKSLHYFNQPLLFDSDMGRYYPASKAELWEKNLKPEYLPVDKPPRHPKCNSESVDINNNCLAVELTKFLTKKYRVPARTTSTQEKMYITFQVDTEGKITLRDIVGGSEPFRKEAKRVIKKLPKLHPAEMRGLPLEVTYGLPLVININ